MKKGYASRTELSDLDIIDDKNTGTSSLAVTLSGETHNLLAAQKLILDKFPQARVKREKGELRFLIPLSSDDEGPSTTDLVEQIVDTTGCKLNYHFSVSAKKHGSKFMPELTIELNGENANPSLFDRVVIDVIERKINPSNTNDPLTDYDYERAPNGRSIIVRPRNEVCEVAEQVIPYAMVMGSHFKHRLDAAAHNIRMTGLEGITISSNDNPEQVHQGVRITITGDEDELQIAKYAITKGDDEDDMAVELVPPSGNSKQHRLQVIAAIGGINDLADIIRNVHLATGCKLPVTLAASIFNKQIPGPDGKSQTVYSPAVGLLFHTPDTDYNQTMVQGLAAYVASHSKINGSIAFPMAPNPFGQGQLMDLRRPAALIAEETYMDIQEAEAKAKLMVQRLAPMLEHEKPQKGFGR